MSEFQRLETFIEVVRSGNLSAASRNLGCSTASVSRSIAALESEVGFKLFTITSRQLVLTDAGAAFFPKVERILMDYREATEFAKNREVGLSGTLKVHARVAIGTLRIAPLIPSFLQEHPDIKIEFMLSNEVSIDIVKHNIDVDIRTGSLADSSLIATKLSSSVRVIVASPGYVARHGRPETPADLASHNCLVYRPNGNRVMWRFRDAHGNVSDFTPEGNLETDSGAVIRTALLAHHGIGHMTQWAVGDDIRRGDLIDLFPDYSVTTDEFGHGIYAVYSYSRKHSAKVKAFVSHVKSAFKSED